ncbi:amino acid/polyamine transporter I [Xylogone sp. PMI_703]|nr:amino acid/polyamine transporter I [Xylogone sp. PMI_703]
MSDQFDNKSPVSDGVDALPDDVPPEDFGPTEKIGTKADHRDMIRMGKNQELRRNFRFLSILGFTCILMSTWEGQLTASTFGLINGGLAGLIWTYLGTFVCFLAVIASMAEMASMAPTSGGQYHWVSEFAPASAQKFLSYITGWVCVLGWQTGITSIAFLTASQIQSLLVINDVDYNFKQWHGTLLIIAVSLFSIIFNTYLAKRLPLVEGIVLIFHICGFFAILVPLWVLAPRNKASDVFTQFTDGGNWGNIGLSCLIGMLSPVFTFIGPDSATHMSEEIKDASLVLPRAMIWTALINGSLGFIMLITFCFTLGNIGDILSNPEVMPFVQVFYNTTHSHVGTSVMTAILIILTTCGTITNVATASRQMFAFARDNGLPFSRFLSKVQPGWDIPLNAVIVSFCITILLSLINIGSTTAFNAIASLGTASLLSSYIVSISCVFLKRWRNEPLPSARWSLGKWGIYINGFSVLYLLVVYIFSFFPEATPVTPETMNWNILIYGFTVCFAIGYFLVRGRHVYSGPVVLVRKDV